MALPGATHACSSLMVYDVTLLHFLHASNISCLQGTASCLSCLQESSFVVSWTLQCNYCTCCQE
jgi:hypothetical protein